jgi:hypothetical protein
MLLSVFLYLLIYRNSQELNIYSKPASTDTTIHFTSNHPMEQKLAEMYVYLSHYFQPIQTNTTTFQGNVFVCVYWKESYMRHNGVGNPKII